MILYLLCFTLISALNALNFQLVTQYFSSVIQQNNHKGVTNITFNNLTSSLFKINNIQLYYLNQSNIPLYDATRQNFYNYQIDLQNVQSVQMNITFLTNWQGDIMLQIGGFINASGSQIIYQNYTFSQAIGPVIQNQQTDQYSQLQSISDDVYNLSSTTGIMIAVLRSIRYISNLLFPFSWYFAIIFMTGPKFLPRNLYYFTGMISSLNLRYQVTDFSLTNCYNCQINTQKRSLFYLVDQVDQSLGYTSCMLPPNYSNNQFFSFDFTLLCLVISIAFVLLIWTNKTHKINMVRKIQIAFIEGSIIELNFLSTSKFMQVTMNQSQGLELFLGIMGILFVISLFIFALRPFIFLIRLNKADYFILQEDYPTRTHNSNTHSSNNNTNMNLNDTNTDTMLPVLKRRNTAYPGKVIKIEKEPTTLQIQYFSPFYGTIIEALMGTAEGYNLCYAYLIDYQIEILGNFCLGLTLPLLSSANMETIYLVGLSFSSIKIFSTLMLYYLSQTLKEIQSVSFSIMILLQLVGQSLLLTIFVILYSNYQMVQNSLNLFQFENNLYQSQSNSNATQILPPSRPVLIQQMTNINNSGTLIINLIISYLCIVVSNQLIYAWISLNLILNNPNPQNSNQNKQVPKLQQVSKQQVEMQQMNQDIEIQEETRPIPKKLLLLANISNSPKEAHESKELNQEQVQSQIQFVSDQKKEQEVLDNPKSIGQRMFSEEYNSDLFVASQQNQIKMLIGDYQSGKVIYDKQQGKIMVPKKKSLDYSKIFNEGTIKIARGELVCLYSFEKEVVIGGVPVGPEHTKFIRKANLQVFMNDMRVRGVHKIKFQNINKVNNILIRKIYIKVYQEGKMVMKEIKLNDLTLRPGDCAEVQQYCSFDYISSEINQDKIEIKGAYYVFDGQKIKDKQESKDKDKIIKVELCNNELRLMKIIPYTNKQFTKLQQSDKEAYALIIEEKLFQFNIKNVICYIQHHQLLQFQIDTIEPTNEIQLIAYFGKLGLIIANSPFVNFHFIIEVFADIQGDSSQKKVNYQENNNQYILISLFVKKTCESLTQGHKMIVENYCRELVQFMRED